MAKKDDGGCVMAGTYAGCILRVDLSTGRIEKERPSEEILRAYIGGKGGSEVITFGA